MDFSTLFLLSLKPSARNLSLTWIWISPRLITSYSELALARERERGELRRYWRRPQSGGNMFRNIDSLGRRCPDEFLPAHFTMGGVWPVESDATFNGNAISQVLLHFLSLPSDVGLGQRHTFRGPLTNTRVHRSMYINPIFPGRCGCHSG